MPRITPMNASLKSPMEAIACILEEIAPVSVEEVALDRVVGRVVAAPLIADRDSPPVAVSAMDGYVMHWSDVEWGTLPVVGEALIGQAAGLVRAGTTLRIYTGSPIPAGGDVVVPREEVREQPDRIHILNRAAIKAGQHIRRAGENGSAGATIVDRGCVVTPAVIAALAACGVNQPSVHRRVRCSVVVTGNEVVEVDQPVAPWQIHDSNGPALAGFLSSATWIQKMHTTRSRDDRLQVRCAITEALATSDAVLLTGGVSMGDYDYVPEVLRECGCRVLFHRLSIRPGKPILGAIGPDGQVVLALPGNPVSVLVTARWLAMPILQYLAGIKTPQQHNAHVQLFNPDDKRTGLYWARLVRLSGVDQAEIVDTRGSGDWVSSARSDGFVVVAPDQCGAGPWPFYSWSSGS
ncbi:MAG: hypothetical protein HJJLKODD_02696 [Phycisphaerae bacterium]|nr:hypothetical protein [Phycisphaerae bacterium]